MGSNMPSRTKNTTTPLSRALKQVAERQADPAWQRQNFRNSFRRSRAGNLWCKHDGLILTVFYARPSGRMHGWKWCISDGLDKRFHDGIPFGDADAAIDSLFVEVGRER
jgi:hypothetical protein